MTLKPMIGLAALLFAAACAASDEPSVMDRSQFAVIRDGIDMDKRAVICADDPQSVGFETSQACFADAAARMQSDQ